MPGCLNCCCQRPDPLYLPVRAEGRNGGYWNVRMSELEPPLPACVPTGTSFAPVRVHLHSLSLRVCRVKAVSFPCKLCSYILTNANSAFIPKGQLVFLGNLQPQYQNTNPGGRFRIRKPEKLSLFSSCSVHKLITQLFSFPFLRFYLKLKVAIMGTRNHERRCLHYVSSHAEIIFKALFVFFFENQQFLDLESNVL